ncbi:MAG: nitrate ABC transporter substrate-binding protein, partial [Rhodopirellula sp. JB055]
MASLFAPSTQLAFLGCVALASMLTGGSDSGVTLADLEAAAAKVDISKIEIDAEPSGSAAMLDLEKTDLTFGFIKLTDCAPLVI